jgi:hypothetical protein
MTIHHSILRKRAGRHLACLLLCLAAACLSSSAFAEDFGLCFGSGGTVEAPAPKLPADGKQLCVEFRFKALAPVGASAVRVVSQWSDDIKSADGGNFHLDLLPGNRAAFTLRVGKGRTDTVTSKEAWSLQSWHHLLATWNGSEAALYLDGKQIGSRKIDGATVPISTLPLTVGQAPGLAKTAQTPPVFKGFVADVAVCGILPTADAVGQRAGKSIDAEQQGLAAYLSLRGSAPAETVKERVSGQDARISPALARTGWCMTPMWDQPAPEQPNLHIFSYDLSAPARNAGTASDAVPAMNKPSRMILLQNPKTQQFGVLWQDKGSNGIFITWLDADLKAHEAFRLKSMEDGILAAGCTDPNGNLCYVEIQKVPANRDAAKPLQAILRAAGSNGKALGEVPISTGDAKDGLNVWSYGGRWVGSMTFSNGAFGLILPRTMYKSPDGLNHQGAIGVVFPANDPSKFRNLGQITGHSFGNMVSVNSTGEFIGLDLGDCYPRGVNLTKFTAASKSSRVVYTYKTEHSTSPKQGSPKYDEISVGGKTFYKWSNDNNTYTELGGVVEGRVSYSVIFATDRSTEGKILDNSRAFRSCDDPRDLAMVRVVKNFEGIQSGHEMSDNILAGGVPAGSTSETGGFFNFVGNWTKQRQTGAIFLTKHKSGEAAHAPHISRLPDGNILILWEKTGPSGAALHATKVTEEGKVVGEWVRPGSEFHLNREDKIISAGGRAFLLSTDKSGGVRLCFVYEDMAVAPPAGKTTTPAIRPAK